MRAIEKQDWTEILGIIGATKNNIDVITMSTGTEPEWDAMQENIRAGYELFMSWAASATMLKRATHPEVYEDFPAEPRFITFNYPDTSMPFENFLEAVAANTDIIYPNK